MTARSSFDQDIFIDTEELEGFATFSNKSQGIYCQVFHAKNKATGEYVYLKVLPLTFLLPRHLVNLRTEYQIVKSLTPFVPNIVSILDYRSSKSSEFLVIEDFGGESLRVFLEKDKLLFNRNVQEFLKLAITVVNTVGQIHEHHVIHKDLKPDNLMWCPSTKVVKIGDFGSATVFSGFNDSMDVNIVNRRWSDDNLKSKIEAFSFAYISPEQTGRTTNTIDYRTDFYSLGVTFFELVTGRLPFESNSRMELLHSHLAREPPSPHDLDPSHISPCLSLVILKMMAKSPDDRYQSAEGIEQDLIHCQSCMVAETHNPDHYNFVPGRYDKSRVFKIPLKLYGRREELLSLMHAFQSANVHREPKFLMVTGSSGSGKTSLVNQLKKMPNIYFAAGKFVASKKDVPYTATIEAIDNLIAQVLFEEESTIQSKRKLLQEQLGLNAKILVELIPSLELIIGKQTQSIIEGLSPTEMLNLLSRLFIVLLRVLSGQSTTKSKMIVLFLDDIQWADEPSLIILEALLSVKDLNLFCIAGARDNELDTMVIQRLESMKKKSIKINSIFLSPLKISDLQELISDTLHLSPNVVEPLADLVYEKTKGNPFFVGRLLNTLFKKKLLFFDTVQKCWTWDLNQIEQIGFSDNVIELLVTALDRIPRESLDLLKLGSCFGNTFDIRHLAHLSGIATEKAEQYLFVAIRDGFIKPIDRTTFRFTHDRVQAAAYTFLDSETARDLHLKIGYYLKSLSEEDHLFSIVNHLNKVLDLILDPQDRLDLAKLNLKAGEKAILSLAYQPARSMFAAGVTLLPINTWEDHHELSFDLHLKLATTEYLCKNYTEPEHIFSLCLSHARDVFEKVRVYMYRTSMYIEKGLYGELVKIGLECLTLFDVKIPAKPGLEMVYEEISTVYKNLGTRSISDLNNLPDCSDPTIIATMVMLNKTLVAAYFTDSNLVAMLTGRMVNLSILHGNSPQSCLGYVWFGWSETIKTKRKKYCYEWGTLAIALSEKFNQIKAFPERGQVYQLFGGFVNWLNKPMTTDSEYLKKGFNYSVQVGDYPYATFAAFHLVSTSFQGFIPLPDGLEMIQPYLNFGRNGGTEDIHILSENVARCISELIGLELAISEPDFYSSHIIHRSALTRGIYHTDRMKTLYIMEDYLGAYSEGNEAKQFLGGFVGFRNLPDYYFYRTMTLLALYSMQPSDQQRLFLEEINECIGNFREYSEHCPTNFSGRNVLLEAESGRILGTMTTMDVISKFTLAAKMSEDLNFLHDMALAKELLARYFKSLSEQNFAEASFEYSKWGAVSKCNKMKLYTRRESIDVTKSKLRPQETTYFLSSEFDLEAVISASQELSSIVDVSKLCSTLLTILVKNSGATKGVLFLVRDGKLVLEAASNDIQVSQGEFEHASSSVVNYCWRTQKTIVVSDVMMEDPYTRDPYLVENKVCSLLCSPLIFKGEVRGVIYLENSINRGTFTDERLRIIRILGSQLLISLENAELVSRLKQNTIELQERNEALKEVDKLKDEFLAMTSHEFRTPLNGVIGMTTLLKDTQLNAEQLDYVQHINNSAESLLVLVTDILDLSRLQAQKVRLEEKPFNLVECIETAIDIVEYRGVMKGLNIACFISNTHEMLIGDRSRLKQILINLLNNGIKFTEKGEVIIKVKIVEENEEMVQVEFQVIDTGIGIKSDELELIFKPFGQIDSSYARAHTGSGLGLVICKNLCKLMNGKMWVKSDFGKGSTFGFEIPFKKYKEGQVNEKQSEEDRSIDWSVYYQEMVSVLQRNISGCHVFLENHTNEFAIKSFLDPFEIPIHLYGDKNSFLGSFQTNSESCIYITDAKTAETNFSTISENSIPLLVACSTLLKRPTGELYDLPNVAILKVPIRKTYLLNALYDLCKKEKRKLKMSPSNVTPEEKRMKQEMAMDMIGFNPKFCKILVVEDNLVNQKIIVKMLTKIGYQVDAADNGLKAIELFENNKYDAVLMDVHMPGCNGLEATSRIRKNEVKKKTHVPIIAVTASVADEIACAKAGMDDFIPKPISQTILFSKLEKWVRSV